MFDVKIQPGSFLGIKNCGITKWWNTILQNGGIKFYEMVEYIIQNGGIKYTKLWNKSYKMEE